MAVLERDVEVDAEEHAAAGEREVTNRTHLAPFSIVPVQAA
jgi:hypothetical protein